MNALDRLKNSTEYKFKLLERAVTQVNTDWSMPFNPDTAIAVLGIEPDPSRPIFETIRLVEQSLGIVRRIVQPEDLLTQIIDNTPPDRITFNTAPREGPITMHFVIKDNNGGQ